MTKPVWISGVGWSVDMTKKKDSLFNICGECGFFREDDPDNTCHDPGTDRNPSYDDEAWECYIVS